jgi:hypothetical protein
MFGSVADAEDIVHEAFIRWMKADRSEVREPRHSCAARSRAFVSINSNPREISARPILTLGFPIPW